jgi:cytochrome c oxidase subunit 2
MSTVSPASDLARSILHVYGIITWATIVIALVVSVTLAIALLRFRDRPGGPLPAQIRGHTLLELSWTIAPALILLVIAIPTIQVIFRTQGPAPKGALQITVRGWQWWWEFRYPGLDIATANELYVPAGQPVALRLEGPDVIHSFWIPRLGGKRDVVPGRINHITFTADTPGEYWGQCAEFCGTSHANMRMRVIVLDHAAFDRWVAAQRAPAPEPSGDAADGKTIFARSACVGCHTIRGLSAGVLGPDLTHFGSRKIFAGGMLPSDAENVTAWIVDPPKLKPGSKMPAVGLTTEQARSVAVYLLSLR